MTNAPGSVAGKLVEAIAARDESAIAACFAGDVEFSARVPKGLRERHGAGETAAVEQHLFCTVDGDRIQRARLLCSGFRPRSPAR